MAESFPTFTRLITGAPGALRSFVSWLLMLPPLRGLVFDPYLLLRELGSMLRSGLPLPRAFEALAVDQPPPVQRRLRGCLRRLEGGEPLSAAVAELPSGWYPPTLGAMVEAAERAGTLPELLDELASEMRETANLERRVAASLTYPLVVLGFASVILGVIVAKVMPVYASIYGGLDADLPLIARMLYRFGGSWVSPVLLVCFALTVLMTFAVRQPHRFGAIGRGLRRVVRALPVGRQLYRASVELRFARLLRLLLAGGVPLPEALELCQRALGDDRAGREIVAAASRIRGGEAPSAALAGLGFLSPSFLWFLEGSERRGDFLELIKAMCDTAEERLEIWLGVAHRVVEPAVIVVLGLVIGTVVVGCYQPMFDVIRLVGAGS